MFSAYRNNTKREVFTLSSLPVLSSLDLAGFYPFPCFVAWPRITLYANFRMHQRMIDRDSTAGSKWKSAGFIPRFLLIFHFFNNPIVQTASRVNLMLQINFFQEIHPLAQGNPNWGYNSRFQAVKYYSFVSLLSSQVPIASYFALSSPL